MALRDILQRLFHKNQDDGDMPYSIVMLLCSPFKMTQEVLQAAACKAYQRPYDGSEDMYFVMCSPMLTIVKAGPAAISVLEAAKPYLDDAEEVAKGFKDAQLQNAWREHHTWAAFDLQNRDMPKKQSYRLLAPLIAALLDDRCAGIYLPKENQFTIQSDGSAAKHLASLMR